MDGADVLKYITLACLVAVGLWCSSRMALFDAPDRTHPRRRAIELLSLAIAILTIVDIPMEPVPYARALATLAMVTGATVLLRAAFRAIRAKNFGAVFSGAVPGEVVRSGPYRYIRHPLYTAYSLFWSACAVFSASVPAAVMAAALIALYVVAARSEERDLIASGLGPAYRSYRDTTGLLLPRLFT